MKKIILIIFCFFLAVFFLRNVLLEKVLTSYLRKNYGIESSFERVNLNLEGLQINEVELREDAYRLRVKKVEVNFSREPFLRFSSSFDVSGAVFELEGLGRLVFDLTSEDAKNYVATINRLLIRNKEIENVLLSFRFKENKLIISNLESSLIGSEAEIFGDIDFANPEYILFCLEAKNLSLQNIISFFADESDIKVKGEFGGSLKLSLKNGDLSSISGGFDNLSGGLINVKEEKSLAFLKGGLGGEAYFYLLDNLQNYKYDKGRVSIEMQDSVILVTANFDSDKLGKRNIVMRLHGLWGGIK